MESILDFSKPVDVKAFEDVVRTLASGSPGDIMRAQEVLVEFKAQPDAFLRVDKLLAESQHMQTRFFALQVLDEAILHRWNSLSEENRQAIRNFVMNLIVRECTSFQHIRDSRALLTKMNSTLVSIAKREWPLRWPNFIQDIATSAGPSDAMVENNLNLLRLVGEEVFQFGAKTLTSRWVMRKKEALTVDARYIMELCVVVLVSSSDTCLLRTALETFVEYVPWVPPELVFNEQVFAQLERFVVGDGNVRTTAVRCLAEISAISPGQGAAGDAGVQMLARTFERVVRNVVAVLPTAHSEPMKRIVQLYEVGSATDQEYVNFFAALLIGFLKHYYRHIAYNDQLLLVTHELLIGISNIHDKELFKSCVEYWWWLGDFLTYAPASTTKRNMAVKLQGILSDVRYVLIRRMAKPEEVVIVEVDGELRREHMADVEELQLYQLMRDTLILFTRLNPQDTHNIIINLLKRQLDQTEWSWHNCSTLSWAIGAISPTMSGTDACEIFVQSMKALMYLCRMLQGKENRVVVVSNIMFIAGQYPQYLLNHPGFLANVTRKLLEFMHETFPGVQDMAVDTLLKLARQVATGFVARPGGGSSLAEQVAQEWANVTALLSPQQIQTCFSAAGYMIAAEAPELQADLLARFLQSTHDKFKRLTEQAATQRTTFCRDAAAMTELLHYLRVYSSVAGTCGDAFIHAMSLIVNDLYGFYKMFSAAQQESTEALGLGSAAQQETKYIRLCKREVLRVIERFVARTRQLDFVASNCIPDVFTVVLLDYENAAPASREPDALALAAACVRTLGNRLSGDVAAILDHTFLPTIAMLADSMESFPEFRVNLFKLLQALNQYCFDAYLSYAASHEDIIGGMLWAIKHTDYPTMITGLETLDTFLQKVAQSSLAEAFYTAYVQRIFVDVLVAAMDSLHSSGFALHCAILMKLFGISDTVAAGTPVLGRQAVTAFLVENLAVIPTLTAESTRAFADMCYESYRDEKLFQRRFADFLIEVQIWGAEEENKLQEAEEQRVREAARARKLQAAEMPASTNGDLDMLDMSQIFPGAFPDPPYRATHPPCRTGNNSGNSQAQLMFGSDI